MIEGDIVEKQRIKDKWSWIQRRICWVWGIGGIFWRYFSGQSVKLIFREFLGGGRKGFRYGGLLVGAVILAGCVAGCGQTEGPELPAAEPEVQIESLYSEAELNYEVPVSTPNILVNQLGYLPESEKLAIFRGENLPNAFRVIDTETGQAVFEGRIEERGYNTYTDEYNSYADFSELTTPGSYYVEAQVVGRSYFFRIGAELYEPVFRAAGKQFYYNRCGMTLTEDLAGAHAHSACHTQKVPLREDAAVGLEVSGGWHQDQNGSKNLVAAGEAINTLLLAYELYGEGFSDDWQIPESGNQIPDLLDEIRYEIDWLLKMQDAATGGVYAGISVYQSADTADGAAAYAAYVEPVSSEAAKMYCASLAKFSYLYQEFDAAYATECLKAADRAWRFLEQNVTDLMDEKYFLAATEMYRASGYAVYHRIIAEYLGSPEYRGNVTMETMAAVEESDFSVAGSINDDIMAGYVTYLSTKKRVDKNLCADIMKVIMLNAEEIAARARESQYLTAGSKQQDNHADLLTDMYNLSIVNHIIKNHEYGTVVENHLHYFMGRNPAGVSYIDGVGAAGYKEIDERLGIMNQIELNSKLIFMLSEIKSNAGAAE